MGDHDDRMARFQRVIDKLEQVCKQADDLFKMARELKAEAGESMRLVQDEAGGKAVPVARKRSRKQKGR